MRSKKVIGATVVVLGLGLSGLLAGAPGTAGAAPPITPPLPLPPHGPQLPTPKPVLGNQTPAGTAAPLTAVQNWLGLDTLSLGDTVCTPTHTSAAPLHAVIRVAPGQLAGAKNQLDVLVNGVSQGAVLVTAETMPGSTYTFIRVNRTISFPTPGGTATVQLVLNGKYASALRRMNFGCLHPVVRPAQVANTHVTRGDLAIPDRPFVIFDYWPEKPWGGCHVNFPEQCPIREPDYPNWWYEVDSPRTGMIATDLTATVPVRRLTGYNCQSADAFVTVTMFIPFTSTGLTDPPDTQYAYDFNGGSMAVRQGYMQFPSGYWYIRKDEILPCGQNLAYDFYLDSANQIQESNENNNHLRFYYSTM